MRAPDSAFIPRIGVQARRFISKLFETVCRNAPPTDRRYQRVYIACLPLETRLRVGPASFTPNAGAGCHYRGAWTAQLSAVIELRIALETFTQAQ